MKRGHLLIGIDLEVPVIGDASGKYIWGSADCLIPEIHMHEKHDTGISKKRMLIEVRWGREEPDLEESQA